jgi:hypothetical protein
MKLCKKFEKMQMYEKRKQKSFKNEKKMKEHLKKVHAQ